MFTTATTPTGARRRSLPTDVTGVALATATAFVTSAAWYTALADPYQQLLGPAAAQSMSVSVLLVEVGRCLVLVSVLSVLVARLDVVRTVRALRVAVAAWAAFPAMLMLGSVVHEGVPWELAAIHGGDWLIKLCVVTVVLARRRSRASGTSTGSAGCR